MTNTQLMVVCVLHHVFRMKWSDDYDSELRCRTCMRSRCTSRHCGSRPRRRRRRSSDDRWEDCLP